MGFDDGQLSLNSEDGVFYPGQMLSGKLEFTLDKEKKFRGIYAEVTGKCKVHWTTEHSRRVNDKTEYYTVTHESYEDYMNTTIYLIGSKSGEMTLQPGRHIFPFECEIPPHCPSSYYAERGMIKYKVKVTLDRAFKLDQTKVLEFRVLAPLDLNTIPKAKHPIVIEFEQTFCCWCMNAGICETIVKLPASGFCPKQVMPIEVACTNNSTVEIDSIKFSLKKLTTIIAECEPDKWYDKETIASLTKGPIPGHSTRNYTVEMEIPDFHVYNLASCRFITEEYHLKVEIGTSGCHTDEDESRRIYIGTIPLASLQNPPVNTEVPTITPGMNAYPTGPVVNQPYPGNQYPGVNPNYPGGNGNQPYPGGNPPYPGANPPYPGANPPFPGGNPPYPGANPPYPGGNPPYPGNTPQIGFTTGNPPYPTPAPYPVGPNPPYPNANPPFVNSQHVNSAPYPTGPSPTNVGSNAPYPISPCIGAPGVNHPTSFANGKEAMPLLPPGTTPQPSSPFSSASAPPQTPDDENKKLAQNLPPYPQE